MTALARVRRLLVDAANGRGVASVALIESIGADPHAFWVPASEREPAFLSYSITKTFTAALILELCDEGHLDLEDRLAKWFPRISHAERISIRQLLNHSAGIPDYGGHSGYHESVSSTPSVPWSFGRFAAETFENGLLFEPGEGWAYSNPGYMLLTHILQMVTSKSYQSLVSEYITQPFELSRTFVAESVADLATLAPGTSRALSPDGSPLDVREHYHPGWVSHGVIASTASDIVRFLDALFRGRVVSNSALAQMTTLIAVPASTSDATSPTRHRKPSYGLGLMGDSASPRGLVLGHNGGGPCYSASAFHAFDLGGASVCVMGAIESGFDTEALVFEVFDYLAQL